MKRGTVANANEYHLIMMGSLSEAYRNAMKANKGQGDIPALQ